MVVVVVSRGGLCLLWRWRCRVSSQKTRRGDSANLAGWVRLHRQSVIIGLV